MISVDSIVRDLEHQVYRAVLPHCGEKTARAAMGALFDCLYLNFKGVTMYVPRENVDAREQRERRNQQIWRDFNGHNHAELAISYQLSLIQIYDIVNAMRTRHVSKVQADLFPRNDDADGRAVTRRVLDDYLPAELERVGCDADRAKAIAADCRDYLFAKYPGIYIRITEAMKQQRDAGNDNFDLFSESESEAI